MRKGCSIGLHLSKTQTVLGWLYLPIYLVGLGWGIRALTALLGITLTSLQTNILYFSVNLLTVLSIFGRWLLKSLRGFTEHFWHFVQVLVLAAAMYYFSSFVLSRLLALLGLMNPNPNDAAVLGLASQNRAVMLMISVLAAPIIEEVLVRGVIFGSLHRKSRVAAYIISILLFSFMHIWQHYGTVGFATLLTSALAYIPASCALGWAYEKADTIWAPIVLHAFINAVTLGVNLAF